ncbi:MAG: Uncharacterised protein [Bacteroidota bacterium]|nr:MAG: Uncharacterised protein [Bacteroidota bacterium]
MAFNRWLWIVVVVFSQFTLSQEIQGNTSLKKTNVLSAHNDAFKGGEWFKFRIHYGIFNASYATIEVNETTWEGKPVFHAKGIGRTTGLARWFFKVDDYYDSYFAKDAVRPLFFIRNINEGGYKKHVTIRFDQDENKALVDDKLKNKQGAFDTESNIQDLISCFYYLRNEFDISKIKKDEFVVVNLFFDESNYAFKFKFLGTETMKTKFGDVKTLKFRPYVQSGRVFRSNESITLWVSNDKNRIPLRLQATLRVGSITADLDEFKGLKNPFEIVVKN